MIAGPVGQLATSEHLNTEDKGLLKVAQRSIQRMFRLVNQLMDFNKLENDTLRLYVEPVDVVSTLNNICDTFEFNAREKGLTLNRFGMDDKVESWTDKLEKIMSNLLSNALKFTPTGGHIDVTLDVVDKQVRISVADTGKGIPENQLENVFKRYYQLDNQTKAVVNWGTGIGLYYARRLAELHHGSLTASNREQATGAVFTLVRRRMQTARQTTTSAPPSSSWTTTRRSSTTCACSSLRTTASSPVSTRRPPLRRCAPQSPTSC